MKNKLIIIAILILGLVGSYRLFRPGYPSMQDDMHVFRLQQYTQCINDHQLPCRRITEGGFGYGYPLFNFYSPLPYSIAHLFHSLGASYLDSIKLVLILTSLIRPIGMFLFSRLFFGNIGGLVSATLFSLAPYQALNSYVRGSIAENLAISLTPFIFWAIKSDRKLTVSALVLFLSLSHNLTLLYVSPLIFIFIIWQKKFKSHLLHIVLGYLLASFFLIPAFFEKSYTTVETMTQGYFDFHLHYTTLNQLFLSSFWGFGGSVWGDKDGMSFQVGYLQWIIPLITIVLLVFSRKVVQYRSAILIFFIGFFFLFLTHNKSTLIWEKVPFLAYYQFPWRFIGPAITCFSFMSGSITKVVSPKVLYLIFPLTLVLNFSYFKEDIWYSSLTDTEKLSPPNMIAQSGAGLRDYWPKYGNNFPNEYNNNQPQFISGSGTLQSFNKNSLGLNTSLLIDSDSAIVKLPIVFFPNFKLKVNQEPHHFSIDKELGLVNVELSSGQNNLELTFTNTPIRTISNIISLVSLGIFIYLLSRKNV